MSTGTRMFLRSDGTKKSENKLNDEENDLRQENEKKTVKNAKNLKKGTENGEKSHEKYFKYDEIAGVNENYWKNEMKKSIDLKENISQRHENIQRPTNSALPASILSALKTVHSAEEAFTLQNHTNKESKFLRSLTVSLNEDFNFKNVSSRNDTLKYSKSSDNNPIYNLRPQNDSNKSITIKSYYPLIFNLLNYEKSEKSEDLRNIENRKKSNDNKILRKKGEKNDLEKGTKNCSVHEKMGCESYQNSNISTDNDLKRCTSSIHFASYDSYISSPSIAGTSSSLFFTSCGSFAIKTVRKEEIKTLKHTLISYFNYLKRVHRNTDKERNGSDMNEKRSNSNEDEPFSLLCRYYGVYKMTIENFEEKDKEKYKKLKSKRKTKWGAKKTFYFIVMNNFLPIHSKLKIFDLKGSLFMRKRNRKTNPNVLERATDEIAEEIQDEIREFFHDFEDKNYENHNSNNKNTTQKAKILPKKMAETTNKATSNILIMKDQDWLNRNEKIRIKDKKRVLDQLQRDTEWLRKNKIMDYSLLVGIIDRNYEYWEILGKNGLSKKGDLRGNNTEKYKRDLEKNDHEREINMTKNNSEEDERNCQNDYKTSKDSREKENEESFIFYDEYLRYLKDKKVAENIKKKKLKEESQTPEEFDRITHTNRSRTILEFNHSKKEGNLNEDRNFETNCDENDKKESCDLYDADFVFYLVDLERNESKRIFCMKNTHKDQEKLQNEPYEEHTPCFQDKYSGKVYFLGLIDTLTFWSVSKMVESFIYRACCIEGASSVHPDRYKTRFIRLMEKVFKD